MFILILQVFWGVSILIVQEFGGMPTLNVQVFCEMSVLIVQVFGSVHPNGDKEKQGHGGTSHGFWLVALGPGKPCSNLLLDFSVNPLYCMPCHATHRYCQAAPKYSASQAQPAPWQKRRGLYLLNSKLQLPISRDRCNKWWLSNECLHARLLRLPFPCQRGSKGRKQKGMVDWQGVPVFDAIVGTKWD